MRRNLYSFSVSYLDLPFRTGFAADGLDDRGAGLTFRVRPEHFLPVYRQVPAVPASHPHVVVDLCTVLTHRLLVVKQIISIFTQELNFQNFYNKGAVSNCKRKKTVSKCMTENDSLAVFHFCCFKTKYFLTALISEVEHILSSCNLNSHLIGFHTNYFCWLVRVSLLITLRGT